MSINNDKVGAALLILGGLIFWAGAFTPPYKQWSASYPEYLEIIHQHKLAWIFINSAMGLGVLVTIFGFHLLGQQLSLVNDSVFGLAGRVAFQFGAVFWIIHLVYRLTIEPWLAAQIADGGTVSELLMNLRLWNGAFFGIYMVLAYAAIALFGIGLLSTGLLPAWIGWVALIFGAMGVIGFPAGLLFFEPPLMIHLVPIILGVTWWIKA